MGSIYAIDNLTNNKGMGNAYKTVDRAYKFQDLSDDSPFKKFFAQHRTLRLDSAIGNVKDKVMNKAAELGIYTTKYRNIMRDAELFSTNTIRLKDIQKFIYSSYKKQTTKNLMTITKADNFGTENSHIFYLFTKKPLINNFSYKGFITKLGEIDRTNKEIIHFRMYVSKRFNNTESQNEEKITESQNEEKFVFNKEGNDYK